MYHSRIFYLVIFLFTSTSAFAEANDQSSTITTQQVTHILQGLPDLDDEEIFSAFTLEDDSVWKTYDDCLNDENGPQVSDIVKNTGGNSFFNMTRGGLFRAKYLGNYIANPLFIKKDYTISTTLNVKEFGLNDDRVSFHIEVQFLQLSNNCIYATSSLNDWTYEDSLRLVRPSDDISDEEYLICFKKEEICSVSPQSYESHTLGSVDLQNKQFRTEDHLEVWQLDSTQLEILANWTPGDSIRMVKEIINFDTLPEDELEDILLLCSLLFEEDIDLSGYQMTLAAALNQETEEAVFCWFLEKNEEIQAATKPLPQYLRKCLR